LKTDKQSPATYFKKDISQAHDHLEWMAQTNPDHAVLGLAFVGPAGTVHTQANPSAEMRLCLVKCLTALRDHALALIDDLRKRTPMERAIAIPAESEKKCWDIEELIKGLGLQPLSK
jgi:hypothetical protein